MAQLPDSPTDQPGTHAVGSAVSGVLRPMRSMGLSPVDERRLAEFNARVTRRPGLMPLLIHTAQRRALSIAAWLALAALGLWQGRLAWVLAPIGMVLLPFAWASVRYRHGRQHARLVEAFSVGDWTRMEGLVSHVRAARGATVTTAFDVEVHMACSQVLRGRPLADALLALAPWAVRIAATNPGLYESRLASVHVAAGDRTGYLRCTRAAADVARNDPARVIDLALAEARFGDADAARRLLDRTDAHSLPSHAGGFVHWARGSIALRSHDPQAPNHLGRAVGSLLVEAVHQPAVWTSLAFCAADLAMALRSGGLDAQARRTLVPVLPILRSHADKTLMHVLEQDILFATPSPTRN